MKLTTQRIWMRQSTAVRADDAPGIGFPKLSFGVVVHRLPSLGQPPFDQRGIVMAGVARTAPRWRARLGIRSGRRHRILLGMSTISASIRGSDTEI